MRANPAAVLFAGLALIAPALAGAHPMGNFSISHYGAIRVEPESVRVRYVLDLAEIPTFQVLQTEGLPPEPEHSGVREYLVRTAEALANGLTLEVDGERLPLQSETTELIFPPGAGGLPTLKVGVVYRALLPRAETAGTTTLTYRDGNYPERAGWKEIVATAAPGVALVASSVPERDLSRELIDYPTDRADSLPQLLEARIVFARARSPMVVAGLKMPPPESSEASIVRDTRPTGTTAGKRKPEGSRRLDAHATSDEPVDAPPAPAFAGSPSLATNVRTAPRDSLTALIAGRPVGSGMILFALAVAASLGAFHALEPGHGKTVVAAYLVGARGTASHALLLGLVVTATHTVGVYLLGIVTLYASRHVVPERLYPWLGATSGLLIALLGASLLWRRLVGPSDGGHHHAHGNGHGDQALDEADHDQAHAQGLEHHHDLEHGHHHHHMPDGPVSLRALVALGVSGGIVPCPAALVVLLSAVAMGRVGLGLLLIVAFSAGLAAVLIAIGLLVVYARCLAVRFDRSGVDGPLVRRWLPLTSAAVIVASGVVITVQALSG